MPVLELRGVSRSYGLGPSSISVLQGVNFALQAGEAVAIVGPSGSGKSTLMHVLGLLDTPTSGEVLVQGQSAAGLSDDARAGVRNRHVGFVYQFHHLLREFDALENVLMPAWLGNANQRNPAELRARAERLLQQVGLGHRLNHLPSQLSGGEQQRVALARALMNLDASQGPNVLLADEPTGNLDPHTADEVAQLLFGLVREHGLSIVLVTHNPALAAQCDRVLEMRSGALVTGPLSPSLKA
jgi:lipoprotein-releasing system ATP-binding protein